MQQHTLPVFRVAGWQAQVPSEQAIATAQALRQQWLDNPLNIQAFSSTIYAMHQYQRDGWVNVVVGKLVATDYVLPENIGEVWVAPQNYVVFDAPDVPKAWQLIAQQTDLSRRCLVDFETYPVYGSPKIYIGIMGEVDMAEET